MGTSGTNPANKRGADSYGPVGAHVAERRAKTRFRRAPEAAGIFNIGSGQATSIVELAALLCRFTASRLAPQISAAARVGDIRHCTADNAAAGSAFGYAPAVRLTEGLARLIADSAGDHPAAGLMAARHELAQAGLLR